MLPHVLCVVGVISTRSGICHVTSSENSEPLTFGDDTNIVHSISCARVNLKVRMRTLRMTSNDAVRRVQSGGNPLYELISSSENLNPLGHVHVRKPVEVA